MNDEMRAFLTSRGLSADLSPEDQLTQWQQHGPAGKFEGEPLYVEYFYMQSLDGGDSVLQVMPDEQKAFGLSENDNYVYVYEDNNGFVYASFYNLEDDANDAEMMQLGIDDDTLDNHESEE